MSAQKSAYKQIQNGHWYFFAEPPRLDEALLAFQEAIRIVPEDGEAHLWLAHTLSALGQEQKAIPEYKTAMRLAPDDSRAPISLGSCLTQPVQSISSRCTIFVVRETGDLLDSSE